jgi:hypothetical protein
VRGGELAAADARVQLLVHLRLQPQQLVELELGLVELLELHLIELVELDLEQLVQLHLLQLVEQQLELGFEQQLVQLEQLQLGLNYPHSRASAVEQKSRSAVSPSAFLLAAALRVSVLEISHVR